MHSEPFDVTMMLDTSPAFRVWFAQRCLLTSWRWPNTSSNRATKTLALCSWGGVLEDHLRSLCQGRGIPLQMSGKPKKTDSMNNDLASADVYSKLDQKNVTAWLDLRNKAAHAQYGEYNHDQVQNLLIGVREFAARIAA